MLNMSLSTSSIEILLNARETRSVNCSNDCLVISSAFIASSSRLHLIRINTFSMQWVSAQGGGSSSSSGHVLIGSNHGVCTCGTEILSYLTLKSPINIMRYYTNESATFRHVS